MDSIKGRSVLKVLKSIEGPSIKEKPRSIRLVSDKTIPSNDQLAMTVVCHVFLRHWFAVEGRFHGAFGQEALKPPFHNEFTVLVMAPKPRSLNLTLDRDEFLGTLRGSGANNH
jgi:hypothetical protein